MRASLRVPVRLPVILCAPVVGRVRRGAGLDWPFRAPLRVALRPCPHIEHSLARTRSFPRPKARPLLAPGAALCPSAARLVGVLASSEDLVGMNQVGACGAVCVCVCFEEHKVNIAQRQCMRCSKATLYGCYLCVCVYWCGGVVEWWGAPVTGRWGWVGLHGWLLLPVADSCRLLPVADSCRLLLSTAAAACCCPRQLPSAAAERRLLTAAAACYCPGGCGLDGGGQRRTELQPRQ